MSQLIWPTLAIFLCLFPSHSSTTFDEDYLNAKKDKLEKLVFMSNNFYHTNLDGKAYSGEYYVEEEEKSPREMAQHPNIDIGFYTERGNLGCEYTLWNKPEPTMPKCDEKICITRRNLLDSWQMKLPPISHWYMPPKAKEANPVRNIADLESALNGMSEHDILRTCASAYLFEGEKPKQAREGRTDWLLYLLEGRMECDNTRNDTWNGDVFARGYTVSLWQVNSEWRGNQNSLCAFQAKLIQYRDNQPGGNFLIAAIVGSAQLDKMEGELFWKGERKDRGLAEWHAGGEWEKCVENYGKWLRNGQGEYMLRLKVTSSCRLEEDQEHSDDDEMIVTWDFVVDPKEPYILANNGILDWKEKPNRTADLAKLHLGKGTLRMPDGEVIVGQINFNKGGQKSRKKRSEL